MTYLTISVRNYVPDCDVCGYCIAPWAVVFIMIATVICTALDIGCTPLLQCVDRPSLLVSECRLSSYVIIMILVVESISLVDLVLRWSCCYYETLIGSHMPPLIGCCHRYA